MIEEYGTLSEEELIQEIMHQIEEHSEIDASDIEFKFENDKLVIAGTLQTDEELEALTHILENYVDPKDYELEIEILEGERGDDERRRFGAEDADEDEEDDESDILQEEGFEEVEEDDADFEEEEEEGDLDKEDKW